MDDLKFYEKIDKEVDCFIKTMGLFSEDMKMEFDIFIFAAVSLQRKKKVRWEKIELPNGEEIDGADSGSYSNMGVLELYRKMCEEMSNEKSSSWEKIYFLL